MTYSFPLPKPKLVKPSINWFWGGSEVMFEEDGVLFIGLVLAVEVDTASVRITEDSNASEVWIGSVFTVHRSRIITVTL